MDKSPDHKERALAWLKNLTDSQKLWAEIQEQAAREPKQRMTAASVHEKYYRELIDQRTLYQVIDDIQALVHDIYATPDQICAADAEALFALITLRTNCEVVLDNQRNKR